MPTFEETTKVTHRELKCDCGALTYHLKLVVSYSVVRYFDLTVLGNNEVEAASHYEQHEPEEVGEPYLFCTVCGRKYVLSRGLLGYTIEGLTVAQVPET